MRNKDNMDSNNTQFSLSDVCYEHIKDQFWYGLFGDFRLIIDKSTGCFNATKLCAEGGKRFDNWLQNKQSQSLIAHLKDENRSSDRRKEEVMYEVPTGNQNNHISGTYVNEEFIISIAFWVSNSFYEKVTKIVINYFGLEYQEKYQLDIDALQKRLEEFEIEKMKLETQLKYAHLENGQLKSEKDRAESRLEDVSREKMAIKRKLCSTQVINNKYRKMKEDISPKPKDETKWPTFVLLEKCNDDKKYPFYVVRIQDRNLNARLREIRKEYPKTKTLFRLSYNPNSISLFNRMKEGLWYMRYKGNHVGFEYDISTHQFVHDVRNMSEVDIPDATIKPIQAFPSIKDDTGSSGGTAELMETDETIVQASSEETVIARDVTEPVESMAENATLDEPITKDTVLVETVEMNVGNSNDAVETNAGKSTSNETVEMNVEHK